MSSPSLYPSLIVHTLQFFVMQMFKISIIMNRLRPSLDSSVHIMMSPADTLSISNPNRRSSYRLVPLIVSSIHPSMDSPSLLANRKTSYR